MRRIGRHAGGVAAVLLVTLVPGCAEPSSVGPGASPARVAVADTDGVVRVRLDHRSAETADPVPVVAVPRGATVELVVGSDTAERVLLPTLGQVRYVSAGGIVALRFVPDAPGVVPVVLGTDVQVGRIEVG